MAEERETARIEMRHTSIGGDVTAARVGNVWQVRLDMGGGLTVEAEHEFRQAAIYLALGRALGMEAQVMRWYPEDEPRDASNRR